jgi:hypothetical protein
LSHESLDFNRCIRRRRKITTATIIPIAVLETKVKVARPGSRHIDLLSYPAARFLQGGPRGWARDCNSDQVFSRSSSIIQLLVSSPKFQELSVRNRGGAMLSLDALGGFVRLC